MSKKTLREALQAAGSTNSHVITPEEIAYAEFMSVVLARQPELQEQGQNSKKLRLAQEWEHACQQKTAQSIRKWQEAEADSFYLR